MQTYKKHYSAAIPTDASATTVALKGKKFPAVRTKEGTFRLNKAGDKMRVPSPCWYGRVGNKDVKLFTDREASKSKLRELLAKHERGQTTLRIPDNAASSLVGHLEAWREHLEGKGSGRAHVAAEIGRAHV